jgi:hypothetical protein
MRPLTHNEPSTTIGGSKMDTSSIPAISGKTQAAGNISSIYDRKNDHFFSDVLIPYVDCLIRDNCSWRGNNQYILDLESIDIDDLYHLSSLFVEYDDDLSCISDNDDLETIAVNLRSVMKGNDKESREDFCDHLKDTVLEYYRPRMQVVLDERLVGLYEEDAYENGWMEHSDYDNGELYWARR